jgi:hypothetical protein
VIAIGFDVACGRAMQAMRPGLPAVGADGLPAVLDRLLALTPDDLGLMTPDPADREILGIGDLWPAVLFFRVRAAATCYDPKGLAAALSDLQLGDISPVLSLGPGAEEAVGGSIRVAATGTPGHVAYGPYFRLAPACYKVHFVFEVAKGGRLVLEVTLDGEVAARRRLSVRRALRTLEAAIDFEIAAEAGATVETRVWTDGSAAFSIAQATLERRTHPAWAACRGGVLGGRDGRYGRS